MGLITDAMVDTGVDGAETPDDSQPKEPSAPPRAEVKERSREELDAIASEAHRRYIDATGTFDKENRDEAAYDFKFCYKPGSQWDTGVKENERRGRLCLEMNQLPQFVNAVVNDMRQNRAGVRIEADDEDGVGEAKLRQSIVRGIEYQSRADAVYDQGGRDAVVSGRGWWRVLTEWESDESFNQRLSVRSIPDFLAVVADNNYVEPDGADRSWAIVIEKVAKEQFQRDWPDASPLDWEDATTLWADQVNVVAVADYYRRVRVGKKTLLGMRDGSVMYADEYEAMGGELSGLQVEREREVDIWRVEWFKLAGGQQVLAEYAWQGTIVPVICCIGNEFILDGTRYYTGLIRWARDPQRMYNFAQSTIAEGAALTPKAPYIMAEGQDEGYEDDWDQANRRNRSHLLYKPTTYEGNLLPPPQRATGVLVQPGLIDMSNTARADLRATIGLYDPSLGQRSNETSGRAIMAREQQGDVATFNFPDNQARAIALTGRIVDELLPTVYDMPRQVPTVQPDGKVAPAMVGVGPNRLSKGSKFTIRVDVGPGYATKRQEARESLMQFVQALPQSGPILAPMIAKNHDWEGADEAAEMLEVLLPPPVQALIAQKRQAKQEGRAPPDPQTMAMLQEKDAQLQQMQQQMQEMQAALQQAESGVAAQQAKAQADAQVQQAKVAADAQAQQQKVAADAQAREAAAMAQAQTDIQVAEIKARADVEAKVRVARIEMEGELELQRMRADLGLDQPPISSAAASLGAQTGAGA